MIDLNQKIYNRDGSETNTRVKTTKMVEHEGEMVEMPAIEEKKVTLLSMITHVLLRDDGDRSEESVMKRYRLFKKINAAEEVDGVKNFEFSDEETSMLKRLICDGLEVWFAGSIVEILDNK